MGKLRFNPALIKRNGRESNLLFLLKASEIDRLIETLERPKIKLKNGVKYKYQE